MQRVVLAVLSVLLPIGLIGCGGSGGNDSCSNTTNLDPGVSGVSFHQETIVDFHGDGSAECCDFYLAAFLNDNPSGLDGPSGPAPSGGCGKQVTIKLVTNGGDCSAPSCWDPFQDVAYHGLPANCTMPDGNCNCSNYFMPNSSWCGIEDVTAWSTATTTTTTTKTPAISTAKMNVSGLDSFWISATKSAVPQSGVDIASSIQKQATWFHSKEVTSELLV